MRTKGLIDSAVEHLQTTASVKKVYGDPVVIGGKTIIPVARVALGFGGGMGCKKVEGARGDSSGADKAGDGAARGVIAKPIGVVEISGQETKFIPFAQTKKLAIVALISSGIGLGLGWLLHRKPANNGT
jgi:uncharacterized spore protein YtfJ